VSFVDLDVNRQLNEQIDAAYRDKYSRYAASIVNTILTPAAQSATLQLEPRATSP
jgi:hypothetical protein